MISKLRQIAFLVLIVYFCGATLAADCNEANKEYHDKFFCEASAPIRGIRLPHMVPLPPPPPGEVAAEQWFQFMAAITSSGIELSDEQLEQIAEMKRSFLDKCSPIELKIHSLERETTRALLEANVNAEHIGQIRKQVSAEKQALDDSTTDQLIRVAKILTPEQRRKVNLAIAKREILPLGCPPPPFLD